jgi:multidrug transporter EmrE-like cation transporter
VPGSKWIRIILCGFVTGVVWYILATVPLFFFARDLLTAIERGVAYPKWDGGILFAVDLLMGIWAVWLYTAVVSRYGARPGTAAIAGVAWWFIKSLQSAKWAGMGLIPARVILIPLSTTLVAAVAASMAGAWLYERVDKPARNVVSAP